MSRPSATPAAATIPIRCAPRDHGGRGGRRRHHRAPARRPAAHLRPRHRPADGRDRPAAEPRNGGDRGDAGDRASPQAARRLHRAGEARGADDRGRARCRRAAQPPGLLCRQARRCEYPRHLFVEPSEEGRRRDPARRSGRRVPHRRATRIWKRGARRRTEAHCRLRAHLPSRTASSRMPAMVSPSTMSRPSPRSRKSSSSTSATS